SYKVIKSNKMTEDNKINSHKDLKVWQESMNLVLEVYKITDSLPKNEDFILKPQLRRSVISIPSNISEGFGRKGNKELLQFLYIALDSLSELETQIEIVFRLRYIDNIEETVEKIKFIRVMLTKLIQSIKSKY